VNYATPARFAKEGGLSDYSDNLSCKRSVTMLPSLSR
jgi:hypothetical protein